MPATLTGRLEVSHRTPICLVIIVLVETLLIVSTKSAILVTFPVRHLLQCRSRRVISPARHGT
jgi:hypothetical protein